MQAVNEPLQAFVSKELIMFFRFVLFSLCSFLLVSCASGPRFSAADINDNLQPHTVLQAGVASLGQTVLWGGRVIQAEPKADSTTLEILAFPLRGNQQPDTGRASQGRFLVVYPGYLEPADYSPDRLITVVGKLEEARDGKVGEAMYRYPVLRADDIYLWPRQDAAGEPRVQLGVGIGIMR